MLVKMIVVIRFISFNLMVDRIHMIYLIERHSNKSFTREEPITLRLIRLQINKLFELQFILCFLTHLYIVIQPLTDCQNLIIENEGKLGKICTPVF